MVNGVCIQEANIKAIDKRLGQGDTKLALIQQTCDRILEQTQKTNGRVTKTEQDIQTIVMDRLKTIYTWKQVVKDVLVAIVSVGGIVFALTRILGG
jgi:hypothetical protein